MFEIILIDIEVKSVNEKSVNFSWAIMKTSLIITRFQEKEFLSVQQLKSEKCPRISLQDLLQIMDIRNGKNTVNFLYNLHAHELDLLAVNKYTLKSYTCLRNGDVRVVVLVVIKPIPN